MSLIEINFSPNRKELRKFGIISLIASILFAVLLYLLKGIALQWTAVICAAGFIIFLSSVLSLKVTRVIYLGLILLTLPIALVVGFTLMTLFYFLLLMPIGLIFRLIGRDALCRKFDSTVDSYWIPRQKPDNLDRYFHQF